MPAPVDVRKASTPSVMQAATEIDQALGTVEKRSEKVRRHHVDWQNLRAAIDTGVVDDRVHAPEIVHVVGEPARLVRVGKVTHHCRRAAVPKVTHRLEPVCVAGVHDDVMPVRKQRLRSQSAETVCGAGNEYAWDRVLPSKCLER